MLRTCLALILTSLDSVKNEILSQLSHFAQTFQIAGPDGRVAQTHHYIMDQVGYGFPVFAGQSDLNFLGTDRLFHWSLIITQCQGIVAYQNWFLKVTLLCLADCSFGEPCEQHPSHGRLALGECNLKHACV
jgi:hypothetical protein